MRVKYKGVWNIGVFLTNITLFWKRYKWRYLHRYNGRKTVTNRNFYAIYRMAPFQWLSMSSNLDFKVTIFWTSNRPNSKMVQDRAVLTTAYQYKAVGLYDLSIGTIFNDLERPLTQISRSRQYSVEDKRHRNTYVVYRMVPSPMTLSRFQGFWTSNNSKMVLDGAIVTMAD